ncbi:hypothetical protein HRTV-28_gp55 [Halorubrum tailed virus 28]|uniref:Uncharacterized protein n=1 Tax=Halorubrum tailed virus 28 TaxID=2878009 RepID=A0AAE9BZG6_9CAUD|nr:hypothetical protein M1M39_gp56 [Halorubrum tailed virus 28]UBF23493.1 hypothetical protein HRTV-28_gp55 [Halorubrum tailed virus 28]
MTRSRVLFEIPATGGRVAAHPEEATRTVDGRAYVFARRHDTGEITRAFETGELA